MVNGEHSGCGVVREKAHANVGYFNLKTKCAKTHKKSAQAMHPVPTLSPPFTSVSSCTSSIVGHGSAICARGIFAGFSVSPSGANFGQSWFVPTAPVKCSSEKLLTQVPSPVTGDLSALCSLHSGGGHTYGLCSQELCKQT